MQQYFKNLETDVEKMYEIAREARGKGYDPLSVVEIALATSLAQRVLRLCATVYPQLNDDRYFHMGDRFFKMDYGRIVMEERHKPDLG